MLRKGEINSQIRSCSNKRLHHMIAIWRKHLRWENIGRTIKGIVLTRQMEDDTLSAIRARARIQLTVKTPL
jgi:hypothetical protein